MYAYVDETGNTGPNIFDAAQPRFLTAALLTKTKFDAVHGQAMRDIAKAAGASALHANELGLHKIEELARPLLRVLKKADARFVFSNLEKRYLSITKIVDYLFDTGENLAVPWVAYNLRPLRLLLVFKMEHLVDVPLAKAFWACLMEPKRQEAYRKYVAFCTELLSRVGQLPDARSREVFTDALEWVIANPEEITLNAGGRDARYQHLPNMVAFQGLIDGIEEQSKKWRRPVKLITHDQQMEFGRSLALWHELYSHASDEPLHWPGEQPRVLRRVFGSEFIMSKDGDSPGIQVTDVLLWLFKRVIAETEIGPDSWELLNYALKRAWYQELSFKHVGAQLRESMERMDSAEITEEMLLKGQEMSAHEREMRRERLADFAAERRLLDQDEGEAEPGES